VRSGQHLQKTSTLNAIARGVHTAFLEKTSILDYIFLVSLVLKKCFKNIHEDSNDPMNSTQLLKKSDLLENPFVCSIRYFWWWSRHKAERICDVM